MAERLAAACRLSRGSVTVHDVVLEHPCNARLAREVLAACGAAPSLPMAVIVDLVDHQNAELCRGDDALPLGPGQLDGARTGLVGRLFGGPERRAVRDYDAFASERLAAVDSLRALLLVQFFCAAHGIALAATAPRATHAAVGAIGQELGLGELIDPIAFAARAEPAAGGSGDDGEAERLARLAHMLRRY